MRVRRLRIDFGGVAGVASGEGGVSWRERLGGFRRGGVGDAFKSGESRQGRIAFICVF